MEQFVIYSSSAGSGKTFTLTKEYLKLVLSSPEPDYFKRILAMTFTNDAAQEMKNRILSALKDISEVQNKENHILRALMDELHEFEEDVIREKSGKILYEILQNYSDFAVKTLDSFVKQVVSSFTFDLDLPYNFDVVLDTDTLIAESVKRLINKIGEDEELEKMFLDFADYKIDDGKSWNTMESEIAKYAKVIFKNNNAKLIDRNHGLGHRSAMEIRKKVRGFINQTENEILKLAREAMDLIHVHGLGKEDFFQTGSGVYGMFSRLLKDPSEIGKKVSRKGFEEKVFDIPNSWVLASVNENKWAAGKISKSRIELVNQISGELSDFINKILALRTEKYLVLKTIEKNLFLIPFVALIKDEINEVLASRNEVVLAEFNRKILDVVSYEPVPYIYERIGEKYNHILIDEFQDTSDIQFYNILPLFENSLSKNFGNLIVGDPKQAIYRWRDGNVALMLDLVTRKGKYLKENVPEIQQTQVQTLLGNVKNVNLDVNWRSHEEIILFNNSFFENLMNQTGFSEMARTVFDSFIQKTPAVHKKLGGYVEVECFENKEEDEEKLIPLIKDILDEGFLPGDIAVLCRTNKEAVKYAQILEDQGYSVSSAEALKLVNKSEVRLLIAFLRFLSDPEIVFKKFEVLILFFMVKSLDTSSIDIEKISHLPAAEFIRFFENYEIFLKGAGNKTPYNTLEFLIDRIGLLKHKGADTYLMTLLDFAIEFENRNPPILEEFLDYWELKKEKLSVTVIPSDNAIIVQTIHKSKGLEYPIVLMPAVSWDIKPKPYEEIWFDLNDLGYEELETEEAKLYSAPFRHSDIFSFTKQRIERSKDEILIENLNMLYVAMTRAKLRLYIWLEVVKGNSKGIGKYFDFFLKVSSNHFDEEQDKYIWGKKEFIRENPEFEEEYFEPDLFHPFSREKMPELSAFNRESDESIVFGNLLHEILQQVYSPNDLEPAVSKRVKAGVLNDQEAENILNKLKSVLNHPELKPLFGKEAVVKNEIDILSADTGAKRVDRVTFLGDSVFVLDYKSGEKRKSHLNQIGEYVNLIQQMGYEKVRGLLVYIDPLEVLSV